VLPSVWGCNSAGAISAELSAQNRQPGHPNAPIYLPLPQDVWLRAMLRIAAPARFTDGPAKQIVHGRGGRNSASAAVVAFQAMAQRGRQTGAGGNAQLVRSMEVTP
jgi:hypothetical protein